MIDGIPIGLGYFAVAFSLGIAAHSYGFGPVQGFVASLLTYASAGQYIGFSLYAANATLVQLVVLTVITNLRYILMGVTLNQRMPEGTSVATRVAVGTCITDEIFGISIARPGIPSPYYGFGAWCASVPLWALGTTLGIVMGTVLPAGIVSALSVAIFGMFLAVIIPPSRKDKAVCLAVAVSFALSYAASRLPGISGMAQGNRTIILTLAISSAFALAAPRADKTDELSAAAAKEADEADAAGTAMTGGGDE
ncbi:MAG: AzlC family ABC transporter permease [Mogibacterium sp.]|nr:AzlC family ABC transporter permease [Mogibacterium sp.]